MKYLNQLRDWLKLNLWKKLKIRQLEAEKKFLEKLEQQPDKVKLIKDEREECHHEHLTKLFEATFQCDKCGLVLEVLNDRAFTPENFVHYYESVKEKIKGLKK